mmetsp:Transcript_16214/g.32848  ORF Transcript_16214/g.32848 Transcript_16214/m.32848 type:complete len:88 (-) Transcript_16214:307-570(-)
MRSAALSLYRQMLREGKHFKDYNFREYILRRVRTQFHKKQNMKDPEEIAELVRKGQDSLEVIRRQRMIDNMYSKGANIMEKIQFHPR